MVLLTAVKNFRQYQTRKSSSNALSFVDLSCVRVIEQCPATSQVDADREMELERYHAAFPALGAPVSTSYLQHFDLSQVESPNLDTYHIGVHSHINGTVSSAASGSPQPKQHTNHPRHLKHQHSKDKCHFSNPSNDNHYTNGYTKRKSRHLPTKTKRIPRDKQGDKRCTDHLKKSAGNGKQFEKPWKHLEPVDADEAVSCTEISTCEATGDNGRCETSGNRSPLVSEDVLQLFLADDNDPDSSGAQRLKSLWNEADVAEAPPLVWDFGSFTASKQSAEGCIAGEACKPGPAGDESRTDYSFIEQSMSSLRFCEDLEDSCRDSRLMPLFRDNPFSHMISNIRSSATETREDDCALPNFSCKHCLEAYEVVLDVESSPTKRPAANSLLSEIDSRLNFDWCKYDPPSWAVSEDECDGGNQFNCKYSCDCEFCRSRVWSHTCAICGTPL